MKRRILAVLLTICMVATLLPTAFAADAATALPEAVDGVITLTEDVAIKGSAIPTNDNITIDLAQHTLTITDANTTDVQNAKRLTIRNGKIIANEFQNGTKAVFAAEKDARVELENVEMTTTGAALFPAGNAAAVTVTNSTISAGTYVVGTNASTNGDDSLVYSMNVKITLTNSTLTANSWQKNANDRDTCAVMINVPGELLIDNCTINSGRQAVVVRGGDAKIVNSKINLLEPYTGSDANNYDDANWSEGNNLPIAALLAGNRTTANGAYKYPANCVVENSTISAPEGYKAVYAYGMESTETIDRSVTLKIDEATTLTGDLVIEGRAQMNMVEGSTGATYNSLRAAYDAGETDVKVLRDLTEEARVEINNGKTFTVDLNGHTVNFSLNKFFRVLHGGLALTGEGTVKEAKPYFVPIIVCGAGSDQGADYAVVTIGKDVTLEGWSGIMVDGYQKNYTRYGIGVRVDGTINSVRDTSGDAGHGVYINGQIKPTEGNVTQITLGETSRITSEGNGIYAAGYAKWTLNGEITAPNALSIKSGDFAINGGTYHSTGEYADPAEGNNNGSEPTGAALSMTSNDGYAKKLHVVVNDGTFISDNGNAVYEGIAVNNGKPVAASSYAEVEIKGGSFRSNAGKDAVVISKAANKKVITAGNFTSDPSAYCAEGLTGVPSTESGYAFTVGEAKQTKVKAASGAPVVDASAIDKENRAAAADAAKSVQDTTGVLAAAAKQAAVDVTEAQQEAAKKAISDNTEVSTPEGATIHYYAQTYLKVTPTAIDTTKKTITLDIQPMTRVVASTVDTTASGAETLKVAGETKEETPNAVALAGSEKKLNIQTMEISIELPNGFADDSTKVVYVQHKGYEYEAAVAKNSEGKYIATFTNPHGFSEFTISLTSIAAAEVDGTKYTSLDEAIAAVPNGGTIKLLKDNLSGTVSRAVSFTLTAASSDLLEHVKLTAGAGYTMAQDGNTYTFTYVYTGTTPAQGLPFTDVSKDSPYYDGIKFVYEKGIMKGVTPTTFEPGTAVTRGMLVTLLYRCEGSPAVTGASFSDVAAGRYFTDAVAWAAKNGIVTGFSDGTFRPDAPVSRQQLAVILFRYAGYKGMTAVTLEENLNGFTDESAISGYAISAMNWAVGQGLVNGFSDGSVRPTEGANRAQTATVLMRLLQNVLG